MRILDSVQIDSKGLAVFDSPPLLQNFIAGEFREPLDGKSISIPHPLTGERSFKIPSSQAKDCELAISHVSNYPVGTLQHWDAKRRGEVFAFAGELLVKHWDKMRAIIRTCMPKSRDEAEGEIVLMHRFLQSMSPQRCRELLAPSDGGPGFDYCTSAEVRVVPWGPVVAIHPFNYPMEIEFLQVVGALACGNAMISKPHEYCGIASQALLELLLEAGMPPEVLCVIHGRGADISSLASDPRIAKVLFTGSSATAARIHSPRIAVEQSGLNWIWMLPMWSGADVSRAATGIAKSAFSLGGQRCSTARFLFAHQSWIDAGLLEDVRAWPDENLSFGDGSLPVLLSWSNAQVKKAIQEMTSVGIEHLWGGEPVAEFSYQRPADAPDGRFDYGCVTPALFKLDAQQLLSPSRELLQVLRTERFWANLVVVSWSTDEERQAGVCFINSLPERLTCGICTDNPDHAAKLLEEVRPNGITNVGASPWTTGAEEYKPFGPISPDAASIGGPTESIRRMWLASYNFNFAR